MKLHTLALSIAVVTIGIAATPAANAATASRNALMAAGPGCQLSLPTIDTGVRGRATGFRNEGTTNAVVICQFDTPTGMLTSAGMYVTPIDGVGRTVSCTAVNGYKLSAAIAPIAYSTKSMSSTAIESTAAVFQWTAADFGGTAGDEMPNDGVFSVTCTLPPKTQINLSGLGYAEEIGS